jgi:hypothetical protein
MRGDSLRDFYAKSIALLGLGLLGAIGAAVDYWPTGVAIPRTTALDLRPDDVRPLAEGAWTEVTVPEVAPLRAATPIMVTASSAPIVHHAAFKSVSFIPAPPPPPPVNLQLAPPESFAGLSQIADAAIALPALDYQPEVFQVTAIAPPEGVAVNQKGFFAGWGSSIVDGGSKMGATVANGFQAAGSAIKGGVLGLLHIGRRDDKQRRQTGAMLVEIPR